MIAHIVGLFALLLGGSLSDSIFDARAHRLLEVASQEEERSFFSVSARFRLRRDIPRACGMLDSLTRDRTIGGMFYAYGLMGTYLHSRALLPDSLHRKIREAFMKRTMYRGDTENHWVMYYTGMYLAAQTWPGEPAERWFNGRSSEENFREADEWLRFWIELSTTKGQGEYDSPTYFTVFASPLVVLYEFAADPVMKRRAGMMLDLLFADFAAEHLHGNYAGAHSRDYPEDIVNPLAAPATMWAWLYFGEPSYEPWQEARIRPRHRGSWEGTFGALGSYRLPAIVYRIATDRTIPYVHTETKRVRNIIRFGTVKNPQVDKYAYVTDDFVLGSLQGGILQPIQQHTWDVTFVSDRPNNTLFTLHPYYSGRELAMFFPEEQKFLAGEVDRYHKVYTDPNKWNSSSPCEQVFQHEGALIALYDIPAGTQHQHVDGFFPKTLDERTVDASGWILCRAGRTMIGMFPCAAYEWIEEPVNWRLRCSAPRSAFVVEVASMVEGKTFDAFRRSLRTRVPAWHPEGKSPSVSFTTSSGTTMEFSRDGSRLLNGAVVRAGSPDRKFFAGPFINSEPGSGVIRLTAGGHTRILDFRTTEVQEQ